MPDSPTIDTALAERHLQTGQRSKALIGIGAPTLTLFGVAAANTGEWFLVALIAAAVLVIVASYIALRRGAPTNLAVRSAVAAYTTLLLYLVVHSGEEHSRALWFFSLPLISVMLLDPREGLLWAAGAIVLAIGLMLHAGSYATPFIIRFTITAVLIAGALFWSEILLLRYQREAARQTAMLQEETARLENEITRRSALERELRIQATTDTLTQLLNRRAFMENLQREMGRTRRNGHPLALAILDIDHFKKINDRCGHPVGDTVLVFLAHFLKHTLRTADLVGRIGGEEFAIALIETDADSAKLVIERLLTKLRSLSTPTGDGTELTVSISVGGTAVLPEDTLDSAILRADEALYAAKNGGRDRYCWH